MSNLDSKATQNRLPPKKYFLFSAAFILVILLPGCLQFSSTVSVEDTNEIQPIDVEEKEINLTDGEEAIATSPAPPLPTAVPTTLAQITPIPLPIVKNPRLQIFEQEAADWNAQFIHINEENTGIWQYPLNSFTHPIAIEVHDNTAYLVDKGRVMALNLTKHAPPTVLLEPGNNIDGVLVLEPLDLGLTSDALLVLDRAGDVYRYDFAGQTWQIDRYDRPVEESSGHYFVALEGIEGQTGKTNGKAALLETNYKFVMIYGQDSSSLWNLDEGRAVDLTIYGDDTYVLQRAMHDSSAVISKYNSTRYIEAVSPQIEIKRPRQIIATGSALFVLDQAGRRLRALDLQNGSLLQVYQLPQDNPPSTFAVTSDEQLLLASPDRIYYFNQSDKVGVIQAEIESEGIQSHDLNFLASLTDYTVPIGGSNITFRDFQLPGAPRHYRLGVHQGIDFYWQPGTKVLSVADGTVIRADNEYVPPTAWQLGAWWVESQEQGYTSQETLNKYLGRQVWIQHEGDTISRYAHLSSIEPGIQPGVKVEKGDVIGEVGNSGSPASVESESADAHLHFELWFGDHYLGQFLRPVEVREWIEQILKN